MVEDGPKNTCHFYVTKPPNFWKVHSNRWQTWQVDPHGKGVRNWLISIGFLILVAKIFEIFGFDAGFEGPQPHSKFSILISNRNLLLRNFWLRFRNIIWNYQHFWTYLSNGNQEIWGLWRHCHLIRIFKNIILVVVLVLNIAAQAYWFWFWFRICSK